MAATFIGGPILQAISGYNPIYWYADSPDKGLEGFRYTLDVEKYEPSGPSFTTLAQLELQPRFGDGYMEVNVDKLLQSELGFSPDNFDLNAVNQIWLNGSAAGYEYRVVLGEKYIYAWDWTAWATSINGNLTLVASSAIIPSYITGDIINVVGVTEEFAYTSISNSGGFAQFNFPTTHTFQVGDAVNVRQNSPVSFLAYSVPSLVTSIAANSIVVNIPYAGTPYQSQTGSTFRNLRADGFQQVLQVLVVGPLVFVELDFQNFDGGAASPVVGTSTYSDARTVSVAGDVNGGSVFNGAVPWQTWTTFPFEDYWALVQPFPTQKFTTSAPDGYCVRPENDFYLNFFTRNDTDYERVRVVTRDPLGAEVGRYFFYRDNNDYGDWSMSTFACGSIFGEEPVQVLSNFLFLDGSVWQETEVLGAVGTFTNPGFNYLDTAGGNGSVYLVQPGVLIPGNEYVVTVQVANNNFVQGLIGDENNTYQIFNDQNGTYALNFTATGTDFWLELNSAGGVTQGVDISSIKAKTIVPNVLDCDLGDFDVTLTREALVNVIQNGTFTTVNDWTITNQLGGVATISGGKLNYADAGGSGTSLVVQSGALTPGSFYTVTITSSNNNFALVEVGDQVNTYTILNDQNGTFTVTFTAAGTDFYIVISSAGGVTQGVQLDGLTVVELQDDVLSESRRFSICCDCDGRYDNVEMLFADRLGSILPFNFNLNHRRRLSDITRNTFKQQIGAYTPGPVYGKYEYSTAEHSDQAYATSLTQQWTINTSYMDEELSLYFEEVTTNPRCWIKINGQWVAVHVIDRVQDIKRKNNMKMIMYTLVVQFSTNDAVQGC
jgi:hypothetical protein